MTRLGILWLLRLSKIKLMVQINALVSKGSTAASDEGPRIFALQKYRLDICRACRYQCANLLTDRAFYQRRLDRIRNAEVAKRNRERLKTPTLFPSVPSGNLG